jgi:hypothetical protein
MTPEQEKTVIKAAGHLEQFLERMSVAIRTGEVNQVKWFTPRALMLRAIEISARMSSPDIQLLLGAVHGCVNLFGIRGTTGLALHFIKRSKKNAGSKEKA